MTESKKRKSHPPEFKAKVGLEALGAMKTIHQISQDHGVHPVQVGQWKWEIPGRRNWLFMGSQLVGELAELVMSFLQSAKLHRHAPFAYRKAVLTKLPTQLNS